MKLRPGLLYGVNSSWGCWNWSYYPLSCHALSLVSNLVATCSINVHMYVHISVLLDDFVIYCTLAYSDSIFVYFTNPCFPKILVWQPFLHWDHFIPQCRYMTTCLILFCVVIREIACVCALIWVYSQYRWLWNLFLSGVGSMESSASGRLGVATLVYIFLTQLVAVILGVILVLAIRPGVGFGDTTPENSDTSHNSYTDVFTDLFR